MARNSCLLRAPALTCEGGHAPSGSSSSQSLRHGPAGRKGGGVSDFFLQAASLPHARTLAARCSPLRLLRQALRQGRALGAQQRPQGLTPVSQHSVALLRPGRPVAVVIEAIARWGSRGCSTLPAWSAQGGRAVQPAAAFNSAGVQVARLCWHTFCVRMSPRPASISELHLQTAAVGYRSQAEGAHHWLTTRGQAHCLQRAELCMTGAFVCQPCKQDLCHKAP